MQNYRTIFQLIVHLLSLSCTTVHSADKLDEIAQHIHLQGMIKDIATLSGEKYEGRQAGTVGGQKSAHFVIKRFKHLGLAPAGELEGAGTNRTWIQQQSLSAAKLHGPTILEFSTFQDHHSSTTLTPQLGTDFLPIFDSPSVNVTVPVMFVGYGIDDSARGINDYEGMDVHNRIVMFLRGKPTTYSQWVTHEEKAQTAQQHGAVGFITLTGPILNRYEARRGIGRIPLAMYSSSPDKRPLPGVWIKGALGEKLFASLGHSLKDIHAQLNEEKNHRSTELGMLARLQWTGTNTPGNLINVVGVVPGRDPVLRQESILIGAHRDHFGKQAGLFFAGADDNASGTAVLLEVARLIATIEPGPARTIVFASFDGEERGVLGSSLYVQQPSHPLHNMVAMINVDHVGVGNGKLTVGLTRLPKSIGEQAASLANLTDQTKLYGYFPGGDHVPFYKAKVPTVTVVSSGKHFDFHQPSDTPEKIQAETLQNSTRYALALVWLLANPSLS